MFDQSVLDALPPLKKGGHSDADEAVCAMEALARACGFGTTDAPECASPVIRSFTIAFNDGLPSDAERDRLIRPLLPLMVGTANDGFDEQRMWLCADAAVRVFAANALEYAGLPQEAAKLRALPEVVNAVWASTASALAAASAASTASALAAASAGSAALAAANDQTAAFLKTLCEVGRV